METQFKEAGTAVAASTVRKNTSKFIAVVETAYLTENRPQGFDGTVASLVWGGFAKMSKTRQTWKRATFKSLLIHLHSEGCFRVLRSVVYMDVLANLSTFGLKMIRPIESWKRPSFSPDEQLEDLMDHLFAQYATPVFLITAFYESSLSRMLWYIKLGQGASVKGLPGFPEHLTVKMAHLFRETPRGYDIHQGLIRAQALGFGATVIVADRLAFSTLREKEGNELFWSGVLQFFAKAENESLHYFTTIINYLEFSVRRNRDFSLKGRTFKTLTRDAIVWSAYTAKMNEKASQVMWHPSGIKPFLLEKDQDGIKVIYEIVELTTADDLYEEGADMNHCVADYVDDCMVGDSAIFSLRKTVNGKMRKIATIEISPGSRVVEEVEGNSNSGITNEAHAVITTWSKHVKLTFGWNTPQQIVQHQRIARGNPPDLVRDLEIPWTTIFWLTWIIVRVLMALN